MKTRTFKQSVELLFDLMSLDPEKEILIYWNEKLNSLLAIQKQSNYFIPNIIPLDNAHKKTSLSILISQDLGGAEIIEIEGWQKIGEL